MVRIQSVLGGVFVLMCLTVGCADPAPAPAEEKGETSAAQQRPRPRPSSGFEIDYDDPSWFDCFQNGDQDACDIYNANHAGVVPPTTTGFDGLANAAAPFLAVFPSAVTIGKVQVALGVLNFVPGVNEITIPVSLVLGSLVLVVDSTKLATGQGDVYAVGADIATTLPIDSTVIGFIQVTYTGVTTYRAAQ